MDAFMGEIRLFSFGLIPRGWAACVGTLMPINQNQALFYLLGTNYGGDGQTTFALPDLRGRVPMYAGQKATPGGTGGEAQHVLAYSEMPVHSHMVNVSSGTSDTQAMANSFFGGATGGLTPYIPSSSNLVSLNSASVGNSSGGGAHDNMQPYLAMNYCIALTGVFPSRP